MTGWRERALLLCALAACGNNQPSAPAAGREPTPAKAPEPTFRARLAAATLTREVDVDAIGLGHYVEAYLITEYGAAELAPGVDQQVAVSLALFGDHAAIRVDLGCHDVPVIPTQPFGSLEAASNTMRFVDGEAEWTGGRPLLAQTVNTVAFAVTVDEGEDELAIDTTDANGDFAPSDRWERHTLVHLAQGALVVAPAPQLDAAPLGDTIPVRLIDLLSNEDGGEVRYVPTLQVGDLAGPLGVARSRLDEHRWLVPPAPEHLPGPLPRADAYLAQREYLGSIDDRLLVGRVGDALVAWERFDGTALDGVALDGEWEEILRVPLPAGAKLDVAVVAPTEVAPAWVPSATITPAAVPRRATTFRARLAAAPLTHEWDIDATALGGHVEAYLITEYGAAGGLEPRRDQQVGLSLALFGGGAAIRVELGHYEIAVKRRRPFGALEAATGVMTTFDDEAAWTGGTPLLAKTVIDPGGVKEAFAVTLEDDALVISYTQCIDLVGADNHWVRGPVVQLAPSPILTTPALKLPATRLGDTIPVRLTDVATNNPLVDSVSYVATLQLGDLTGPIAVASVQLPDRKRWTIPAVTSSLPGPLPHADAYLAHREYFDFQSHRLLVGRVGDALVVWDRLDDIGPAGKWEESLRLPLPAGATLDVQ